MKQEIQSLQQYKEFEEAILAVDWLKRTRPYLFDQKNYYFYQFDDYLNILGLSFEEVYFCGGEEVDAGGSPNENYEIVHINRSRWEKQDSKLNSALMVHELSEGYLQYAGYTFFSQTAHIIAEFFEGNFREELGLSACRFALSSSMIPKIRKFEKELEQRVITMKHYDVGLLLSEYVAY